METKGPDETARAWDEAESVQFAHVRRHFFSLDVTHTMFSEMPTKEPNDSWASVLVPL